MTQSYRYIRYIMLVNQTLELTVRFTFVQLLFFCELPVSKFPISRCFFYSQQKRRKPFSFDPTDPLKAAASQVDKSNGWDFRLAGPGAKKRRRFFSNKKWARIYPIPSMYGIFTYIYHTNQPNVGKYTIHGSYGYMVYFSFLMSRVHYWRTWFIVLLRSRKKTKKNKKIQDTEEAAKERQFKPARVNQKGPHPDSGQGIRSWWGAG